MKLPAVRKNWSRPANSSAKAATPPPPAAEQPAAEGAFWVQVVAGRDRASIENVIDELRGKGYSARLFSEREGAGSLFKVRVGGYGERGEADQAAEKLRQQGYSGAWVTTAD